MGGEEASAPVPANPSLPLPVLQFLQDQAEPFLACVLSHASACSCFLVDFFFFECVYVYMSGFNFQGTFLRRVKAAGESWWQRAAELEEPRGSSTSD